MHKILVLWATSRSRSTAFERMMFERGDFKVIHEPFGRYYYFSSERRHNRASQIEPKPEYAFEAIIEAIFSQAQEGMVFIKEQAYQAESKMTENLLAQFTNTFLLRHPQQVIPSLFNKMPDFTLEELGYEALYNLFEKCQQLTGNTPVLIDSDDLIEQTNACIQGYCQAVEMDFIPKALTWKPTLPKQFVWWEGGHWLDVAGQSDGFKEIHHDYVNIEDHEILREAYDRAMPYYEAMIKYKLKVDSKESSQKTGFGEV